MTDREIFDLELSPGEQPPSGIGDRVLVGIAGIALLAGLAIAVINAVPHEETAEASAAPSAAPSRTPVPIPTPAPARVATVAPPDIEIVQQPYQQGFSGWIRALTDVIIVAGPEPDAARTGVLAKGSAAYVDQENEPSGEPGWLHVQDPEGWIASIKDGEQLVRRYAWPRYRSSGWVNGLTSGPQGALAMITPVSDPDRNTPSTPTVSSDGATWRSGASSAFGGWEPITPAWGPAGWLAVTYVSDASDTNRIWLWKSADGRDWNRLGMLAGINGEYPSQLVGSDRGYLLLTDSQGYGGGAPGTTWFSPDGRTWTQSTDRAMNGSITGERRIRPLAGGFYMWDFSAQPLTGARFAAFSADGLTWRRVAGQDGVNLQVTSVGSRTIGIDADLPTLEARVWSGTFARGQLVWIRRPEMDAPFAGGVVTQLVTDGERAYAFGWDRSSDRGLVWTLDGGTWTRAELPASFGGIPMAAAAWPGGVVAVGHRPNLRGDNPILWHLTPGGGWLPESDPIMAFVPEPTNGECPALPTDFLEFAVADASGIVACHGAEPFSFRAWSVPCDQGCYGYEGMAEPAWLLQPTDNQLYLTPTATNDGGWWSNAVVSPRLKVDRSWASAWVELTGHYDDPAAATCRRQPTADELQWWSGQQALITQCRTTFVTTDVKVVSGP
jgi:hypothetical protein